MSYVRNAPIEFIVRESWVVIYPHYTSTTRSH